MLIIIIIIEYIRCTKASTMEENKVYACKDASNMGKHSAISSDCGGCAELSTLEQVQNDERYISLSFDGNAHGGEAIEARPWIEFLRKDNRIWKRIVLRGFYDDEEDNFRMMASILGALNKVESLIVDECSFHPQWVRELASLLDRTTTLKFLKIENICMPEDPHEGLTAAHLLSSALTSYQHLEVFGLDLLTIVTDDIMENNEGNNEEALVELVASISESKSLKTFLLESYNNAEPTTAPMFRSFENMNPKFQELKVRIGDLDNPIVASSFNDLLQSCSTNLISLDLEHIYEDRGRPAHVHPSTIDTFLRKDSARKLRLSYLTMDETVCTSIARGMKGNSNLQVLELSNCNISAAGVSILAVGICQNGTLQQLTLRGLEIGVGEAMAIPCALLVNKTLQTVDLSWNNFGDVGAEAIAVALRVNQTLRNLDVSNCGIGDTGATALYDAISHNSTLERFDVSRNILTAAGSKSIAALLEGGNSTLKLLHFDRQQDPGDDSSSGVDFNLSEEVQNKNLHLESLRPVCSIPKHRLHFNRGGRKAIIDSSISLGLWPFILERALRIGYYDDEKHYGDEGLLRCPNNEMPRISVLYSLLQEKPGLFDIPRHPN
jgi:Ran GTPase-activating protein (RanGAP) involved in mRNA processing and transport